MQITLGNIPDGEKIQTSKNGCLFQCEQTFSKGGTEGSKRKRKDTEIPAKKWKERDPRCSIAFPKLVFLLQNARELLKDVGCRTLKHLQMWKRDELGTDAERERQIESRSGRDRNTNVIARDWKNEFSAEALFCYNLYCGYFELFCLTAVKVD